MTRTDENREHSWTFESPEEEIESLKMRLRFARQATHRQRRRAADARQILTRLERAWDAGDTERVGYLLSRWRDILRQRREGAL